ncbi:hypothetical protein RB25_26055 [Herbaspirillum rubrisubalbicans]|uniref:Uncharacterized protein n=1 Tax=Herbaspirillum rubrisubalbicans TaxID=80842 RepID=A0ABX9BUI9_9BURK|nr:hypothetical protein [Herbaspirillum rubrisubalbicans]RAM61402.1 hypothetical protein RB24_25565 [Herbaspirillum rubrisubalbicans]RAN42337.1 hypothetical protein RB25_26055 [Herbaspirillum rubrisubalbicans]
MSDGIFREIAGRYTLLIEEVEKTAARGEVVGDLIRTQVRRCIIEMQAAGAEPDDIRAVFDDLGPVHI